MSGLKQLLRESHQLVLRPLQEEQQLIQVIKDTELVIKRTRQVLDFCCRWEVAYSSFNNSSAEHQYLQSYDSLSKAALTKHYDVGKRPIIHNASHIRILIRQHCENKKITVDSSSSDDRPKPTMDEVAELMRIASLNPVKISELLYINDVYNLGEHLTSQAATILTRAYQLMSAKSRLTLDRTRYSLQEVQALLTTLHAFPFSSDEVIALQGLLTKAITWRDEVLSLTSSSEVDGGTGSRSKGGLTASTVDAVVVDGGRGHQSSSSRSSRRHEQTDGSSSSSSSSQKKPIPLKKVEALIVEGERLPFEFRVELEILKDKKNFAKLWLEKLKKSFVPTKVGNRNRKVVFTDDFQSQPLAVDNAVAIAEKVSLSDMKLLVSEGEMLFQPIGGEFNNDDGNVEAFAGATGRSVNRDLDRAVAVVESAEDWIYRARELLLGEGFSAEHDDNNDLVDVDYDSVQDDKKDYTNMFIADDDNGGGADGEEEEGGGDVEDPDYVIQVLRAMLDEADHMPVTMDEVGALRCNLQALEWAAKVKPYLLLNNLSIDSSNSNNNHTNNSNNNNEGSGEDEGGNNVIEKASRSKKASNRKVLKPVKPRLVEMQQFAKEITK
jgi:hypothetical protein